ncbi:uncharacterized protein [Clytia hemisphaerica]|uniref:Mab-21-like HhH/H2TH-like domain-containing protein n=1 Tax=Clytia hemisphaerica TaxID=252671 RepID=A0A7M5XJJ3_9CNID|eukprot:TCONS_00027886-protein
MKRPCFPYQFWMQDLPWSTGAKVNPDWDETDVGITDSLNQAIISIAEKEAQFPINEKGLAIQRKMGKLLENVTEDLKTNHKSFKDSTLYYTGSMYEGLKIDAVDEFDFMIEMPVLSKVADISMKSTKQMLQFELKDLNPFNDSPIEKVKVDAANIQEFFDRKSKFVKPGEEWIFPGDDRESWNIPAEFNNTDPSHWMNMAIIIRAFGLLVQEKIQHHLPREWKFIPNEFGLVTIDHFLQHKSAFTFDIVTGENQIVNIDVDLCLPIYNLPLLMNSSDPGDILPEDFKQRFRDNPSIHHAIIRNSNTLRISLSCKEKEAFTKFDSDDPRKLCMRFFKYLRSKFITHLKWHDDAASCLVNSYHIKTIFLYLFEIYPEQSSWNGTNFGIRLKVKHFLC